MNEMQNTFLVREACHEDASTIADFQQAMAMETEGVQLDPSTLWQGVISVFQNPGLGRYFVLENEGKVIASLLITPEWSDWRNTMIWWIQSVFVRPESRKMGCYSALYKHIQQLVENDPEVGGIRLYVDKRNEKAIQVYRKMGMDDGHYGLFEWMKKSVH